MLFSFKKGGFTLIRPRASFPRPSQKPAQAVSARSRVAPAPASPSGRSPRGGRPPAAIGGAALLTAPIAGRELHCPSLLPHSRPDSYPRPHLALLPASALLSLSPEQQQQPRATPPSPWPSPPTPKLLRNARRSLTPAARDTTAPPSRALFRQLRRKGSRAPFFFRTDLPWPELGSALATSSRSLFSLPFTCMVCLSTPRIHSHHLIANLAEMHVRFGVRLHLRRGCKVLDG
jgi:hypothetical protein